MDLRIIATGGTFDKTYDPIKGSLGFSDSQLAQVVSHARIASTVVCEIAMQIDSLDMHDSHRQQILLACQQSPQSQIVIVHGTDTMVATAQLLAGAGLTKTIVLTGAMVPFTVAQSDALFNLGYALACAQHREHGVYVAIGGQCFAWDKVRKNRALGFFESLG